EQNSFTVVAFASFRFIVPLGNSVVRRICRPFVGRERILLELLQDDLDRLLELRVVALPPRLWIELDLEVGCDAVILDLPLALEAVERDARCRHAAAVDERRVAEDPDQPAPRPLADERPESRLAEVPRHRVATRARHLVDDHGLRSEDRRAR